MGLKGAWRVTESLAGSVIHVYIKMLPMRWGSGGVMIHLKGRALSYMTYGLTEAVVES